MKKSAPVVSICVPTHNGARHLRACLDSAFSQSFGDHEVLVVDDGSTDSTLEIIHDFEAKEPRLRLVQNPEARGLPGNWNRCMELARGTWVKFLFQDDVLDPDCLRKMLIEAEAGQSLVVALRRFIFEADVPKARRDWYLAHRTVMENFPEHRRVSASEFCRVALSDPGLNILGEPSATLLHRGVFQRFGTFNTDLIMICDTEYWARIASHDGFAYVPESLVDFRVHRESTSSVNFDRREYRVALDGLVMLHEMLFAAVYEPLRQVALGLDGLDGLNNALQKRSEDAWHWAKNAASQPDEPDDSLLREWSRLARAYPRIQAIASRSRES